MESVAFQSTVTVDDVCKEVLDCGPVESPLLNWNITLPNVPKPPVVPPVPPQVIIKSQLFFQLTQIGLKTRILYSRVAQHYEFYI